MSEPLYLGLDLGSKSAHWSATCDGIKWQSGEVTMDQFPDLLARLGPCAVGMEYTGRRAESWCLVAERHPEASAQSYIMHTRLRVQLAALVRQVAKTDAHDALSICHYLRLWHQPATRAELGLPADLFTDLSAVRESWTLRAMVADAEAWVRVRAAARNRLSAALVMAMPERVALWESASQSPMPEVAYNSALHYCRSHFALELRNVVTIPSIGERTALLLIAGLSPISRFESAHPRTGRSLLQKKVSRYVGLSPKVRISAGVALEGHNQRIPGSRFGLRPALSMCARSCAVGTRTDFFALRYRKLVSGGLRPIRAINRVATLLLRVAVSVLRSGKPYFDPEINPITIAPPGPQLPSGLVSQSEAARMLGISRQAVGQRIKRGTLPSTLWGGVPYILVSDLPSDATPERMVSND